MSDDSSTHHHTDHSLQGVPLTGPHFRGNKRLRIALLGQHNCGKSTIFDAVASTSVKQGHWQGTSKEYQRCIIQVGLDEVELVDLPAMETLQNLQGDDLEGLKYLLWGDARPSISAHESKEPPAPFSRPDVLIHIIDASTLHRHLALTLELIELGLPIVIGLNMVDEARRKGVKIDVEQLAEVLGVPVIPMIAIKGIGILQLFEQAVKCQHHAKAQPASEHVRAWSDEISTVIDGPEVLAAFKMPANFLVRMLKLKDDYLSNELKCHFPEKSDYIQAIHQQATEQLKQPLHEAVAGDYHHRAAKLFDQVARLTRRSDTITWEDRLDAIFLHPKWGLIGSLGLFALVLYVVFEVSTAIDALTAARLADLASQWQPTSTAGIIGHAVIDALVGLIGIVVPYMLPLVLMLVAFEESGIMPRVAFVVDRFFHHIGLHGKVAVPFLLGLGCNVPAIATAGKLVAGRDRIIASLLITFVPCSARSAIVLALGGKYLGGLGIFGVFFLNMLIIALLGKWLVKRYPDISPGLIQEIPAYTIPRLHAVLHSTWLRTRDILTIVTPLLIGGSIILEALHHFGADLWINQLLMPITVWALGLPVALGVPILFGVLRKELSLLMVYQALNTFDVGSVLDWVQISTFLIFLMFYVPCVSTFAVMVKTIGRKEALFSIALSMVVALMCATIVRILLELINTLL